MPKLLLSTVLALLAVLPARAGACVGLGEPMQGPLVRSFAPSGRYAGHWGVDWGVPAGTAVTAAGPGTVTYAGVVAGNRTVTVHHGGGLRTSNSYLSQIDVRQGQEVAAGTLLGRSGVDHDTPALHFSTPIDSLYVDPLEVVGCHSRVPATALRLVHLRAPP